MYPSLYFCCVLLVMNINYAFGVIDLKVKSEESVKWLKHPLTFEGFAGCSGANLKYEEKYLIFEIKDCGTLRTDDASKPLVSSHMRFLWPKKEGNGILENENPGKLEGSMYSIDGQSNTMEVQIFFHPAGKDQSFQRAVVDDELRIVSFFLQTETRLMNNPKLERLMKFVNKVSVSKPKVPVSSALLVQKVIRSNTGRNPSGPSVRIPGLFDAFFSAFKTRDKRVFKLERNEFQFKDKLYKATVYVIDAAIPISPEQVAKFEKLVVDYQAQHRSEKEDGLQIDVMYGDKREEKEKKSA